MAAKKGIWQTERGFHLIYRDVCQNFGIYHDLRPNMFFPYRISFLFQLVIWTNTRLRYRLCFHHNFQLCNFSINYFGVAMRIYIYILFNIIYICTLYIIIYIYTVSPSQSANSQPFQWVIPRPVRRYLSQRRWRPWNMSRWTWRRNRWWRTGRHDEKEGNKVGIHPDIIRLMGYVIDM